MREEKFDVVGDVLSDMDRASRAEARMLIDAGRRGEKESREALRLQGWADGGARKEAGGGRPEEGPAPGEAAV